MKQQSLFKQTLLDLINEKPLDKKAFRQGHNWAECQRRSNMTVRKTISQDRGHSVVRAVGEAG